MIRKLSEFIRNANALTDVHPGDFPPGPVIVRSINLNRRGPTAVIRLDVAKPPTSPNPDWARVECDRVQCHVAFLDVREFRLEHWLGSGEAEAAVAPMEPRRLEIRLEGPTMRCSFTASDSVTVRHVSAYRSSEGQDRQFFASPLDRRRFTDKLPWIDERTFYG
ncbi:hypothetical protein IQ279_19410 [Streptomyces verrucosisporus]|nr:hypothetical protein [Streptomyces verrucosisporus]